MTSVDSGVETGNDSNDSSVNQHENNIQVLIPAGQQVTLRLPVGSFAPSLEMATNRPLTINNQLPSAEPPGFQTRSGSVTVNNLLFPSFEMNLFKSITLRSNNLEPPHSLHTKIRSCDTRKSHYRYVHMNSYRDMFNKRRMRTAAATNNIELMKNYLSLGISPNNSDEQGRSPLHLASCSGYTEMVELLLQYGANPNMRDCVGNTPLHVAAISRRMSVVMLLLEAGTDVPMKDELRFLLRKYRLLHNDILKIYLEKRLNAREEVEALTMVCSRLSLSNTPEKVQDDVFDETLP